MILWIYNLKMSFFVWERYLAGPAEKRIVLALQVLHLWFGSIFNFLKLYLNLFQFPLL